MLTREGLIELVKLDAEEIIRWMPHSTQRMHILCVLVLDVNREFPMSDTVFGIVVVMEDDRPDRVEFQERPRASITIEVVLD